MRRVGLPEPAANTTPLANALKARRSAISFEGPTRDLRALTIDDIGSLFGMSLRSHPDSHRPYPSGGSLYPIETYLFIETLLGCSGGIYHYNPSDHALEFLWPLPPIYNTKLLVPRSDHLDFSALIVFTAVWNRSSAKYGDFAYLLSLLEAGHMSQNIALCGAALDLATCPVAGFEDDQITTLLDLDSTREQPVHVVSLGRYNRPTD
jgi:SagB-type dehydrogenase family enzyme